VSVPRLLGWAALVLGAAAPFAGNPHRPVQGPIDANDPSGPIAGVEEIDALQLARWIRYREPGLRVFDLRSASDYSDDRIPGAEHVDIDAIDDVVISTADRVVTYADSSAQAAQAGILLRARGPRDVYWLRGGIRGWFDDVIDPYLPADASPEARRNFESTAELSRYFGGVPRIGERSGSSAETPGPPDDVHKTIARARMRGC